MHDRPNSAAPRILIADDDPAILKLLKLVLADAGFRTIPAATGEEAIQAAIDGRPDLVILDLVLPDITGLEVLNRLRERAPVPVIMLTGKSRDTDKILGLEMGADDYLAKPFNPDELVARVRAVLRRAWQEDSPIDGPLLTRDLTIDLAARLVTRHGDLVPLTRTEWSLLDVLVKNRGRLMLNRQILSQVWGPEYVDDLQYLRVWVSRLRQKLEPERPDPSIIQTFPGMGYMFRDEPVTDLPAGHPEGGPEPVVPAQS